LSSIKNLLANNAAWAARCLQDDPGFFQKLAAVHQPRYLWIGCSDARVPANTLLGVNPGEVFVHRNIANQVSPYDSINAPSAIDHAVTTLGAGDVIICGHYGCSGIQGILGIQRVEESVRDWLRPLQELYLRHREEIDAIPDLTEREHRLVELNVQQQVLNICQKGSIQQAWKTGRDLSVHGLVYALEDGLLRSLDLCISGISDLSHFLKRIQRTRRRTSLKRGKSS